MTDIMYVYAQSPLKDAPHLHHFPLFFLSRKHIAHCAASTSGGKEEKKIWREIPAPLPARGVLPRALYSAEPMDGRGGVG